MIKLVVVLYLSLPGVMPMVRHLEAFWGLSLVELHVRTKTPAGCRRLAAFRDRSCWRAVEEDTKEERADDTVVLAVLPPIKENQVRYFGGLGYIGRGLSLVHCRRHDLQRCGIISAHEIGHNLGHGHVDTKTIMNPAAPAWFREWGWIWPK